MPNLNEPVWDEVRDDRDGFRCLRSRLGRQAGCERLGISLWEVPAGEAAYPYHWHLTDEELIVVLAGQPSLRGPEGGWRPLAQGEVVAFPRGERGGHQIANFGDEPVRMLAVSTSGEPDVVVYPDSGKLGAAERRPDGGGLREMFRLADAVGYWEGETPPRPE